MRSVTLVPTTQSQQHATPSYLTNNETTPRSIVQRQTNIAVIHNAHTAERFRGMTRAFMQSERASAGKRAYVPVAAGLYAVEFLDPRFCIRVMRHM
ncbi:MAG: hypothetical protein ING73_03225 [Rhodocyclaceae bacterium]|nr:hypothetical protein [Rhodocyclaceae bacterium]MCA3032547.1 hypothetical protein [Rhodocyclaceae bacterium]MCA3047288.1 hypothetical protein [Rhodocyclaceae bacterium]MCA3050870.1 hypothetical protein [Rhodocyclaceae bacterium]MCA3063344.1 hypothetical protein [Rhodocyclaceae bacterium]